MTQAHYFVGIEQPSDLRRNLLETAKVSVTLLKAQYRLREIRNKKIATMAELKRAADELGSMVAEMEKNLPAHQKQSMPESAKRLEKKPKPKKSKTKSTKKSAKKSPKKSSEKPKKKDAVEEKLDKEQAELDLLEQKLSAIETKLNKL